MKHYNKTIIGSIATFVLGTSCCWLSSLAIWLGGFTFIGATVRFVESIQIQLVMLSIILGMVSLHLYFKNKRRESTE